MALGPGKYDDLCTYVRREAQADAAIVIVLGGQHGSGFSVQALVEHMEQVHARIPDILRTIADLIEVGAADQSHEARN